MNASLRPLQKALVSIAKTSSAECSKDFPGSRSSVMRVPISLIFADVLNRTLQRPATLSVAVFHCMQSALALA